MGRMLFAAGLLAATALHAQAAAGNPGTADPELEFGAITTYPTEPAARAGCAGDVVVWADRNAGYIFHQREPEYGRTAQGAYACLNEARDANYWETGPYASMARGHGPGREFPDHFPKPFVGS